MTTRTAPELLTPDEAAGILRVSTKTLRRMRGRGLSFVMLTSGTIRYRLDDLTQFIEGQTCHTAQKARATGTTTSKFGVVDFTAAAAQMTSKKQKR